MPGVAQAVQNGGGQILDGHADVHLRAAALPGLQAGGEPFHVPALGEAGLGGAGADAADANAVRLQFQGQLSAEPLHGGLGGGVDGEVAHLVEMPGAGGGNVDDARIVRTAQQGNGRLAAEGDAQEVGVDLRENIRRVQMLDGARMGQPGVVDEAVEPAEALLDLGEGRGDALAVRHVRGQPQRPLAAKFPHRLLQSVFVPRQHADLGAGL